MLSVMFPLCLSCSVLADSAFAGTEPPQFGSHPEISSLGNSCGLGYPFGLRLAEEASG
jgi:hypothetical protein